jgi:hypothetical protein
MIRIPDMAELQADVVALRPAGPMLPLVQLIQFLVLHVGPEHAGHRYQPAIRPAEQTAPKEELTKCRSKRTEDGLRD